MKSHTNSLIKETKAEIKQTKLTRTHMTTMLINIKDRCALIGKTSPEDKEALARSIDVFSRHIADLESFLDDIE